MVAFYYIVKLIIFDVVVVYFGRRRWGSKILTRPAHTPLPFSATALLLIAKRLSNSKNGG